MTSTPTKTLACEIPSGSPPHLASLSLTDSWPDSSSFQTPPTMNRSRRAPETLADVFPGPKRKQAKSKKGSPLGTMEKALKRPASHKEGNPKKATKQQKCAPKDSIERVDPNALAHILSFVGPKNYRFVALVSKKFCVAYQYGNQFPCQTSYSNSVTSVSCAKVFVEEYPDGTDSVCTLAAKYGHLEVLQWARAIGYPWDDSTCLAAAQNGHLEVLQWARANGCPWDEWTCRVAAENGHLEVLQWARANGCPWDEWTCRVAAENGHLEVLQWARANGCPWDEWTCRVAAQNGHLEVLQWASANGCPWNVWTCAYAAQNGHLEVLQWARANGCSWHEWTCAYATQNGHLEVLQWARANGCPWDEWTCRVAAENGHLEVLQWARANGCPWNETACLRAAATLNQAAVLLWIEQNR